MGHQRIALLGRPNVGKSTLFNRLIGRKKALVDNQPGITRDRHYGMYHVRGRTYELIDSAGYEQNTRDDLARKLNKVSELALEEADAALLVIDGIAGVMPEEQALARMLHKQGKPVRVVVTKMDVKLAQQSIDDGYALGFGDPIAVSAEHNQGIRDLEQELFTLLPEPELPETESVDTDVKEGRFDDKVLKLTIVGRPNAGKSTLVNQLLGEERMLTGPVAGLTRESLSTRWLYEGQEYELVDTAGLRKRAKITDKVEKMSASSTINALDEANIVVLLLDATAPFEHQDKIIASRTADLGKPLIIALNKWDLVDEPQHVMDEMKHMLKHSFSQVKGVPIVKMSALKGQGVFDLFEPAKMLYEKWQSRISTADINRVLEGLMATNPPPLNDQHKAVRIKYATQVGTRPPAIALYCNRQSDIPKSYLRYLLNGFREAFDLYGITLRLLPRGGKNPYAPKRRGR